MPAQPGRRYGPTHLDHPGVSEVLDRYYWPNVDAMTKAIDKCQTRPAATVDPALRSTLLAAHRNALRPVMARPTMSDWMLSVPS